MCFFELPTHKQSTQLKSATYIYIYNPTGLCFVHGKKLHESNVMSTSFTWNYEHDNENKKTGLTVYLFKQSCISVKTKPDSLAHADWSVSNVFIVWAKQKVQHLTFLLLKQSCPKNISLKASKFILNRIDDRFAPWEFWNMFFKTRPVNELNVESIRKVWGEFEPENNLFHFKIKYSPLIDLKWKKTQIHKKMSPSFWQCTFISVF